MKYYGAKSLLSFTIAVSSIGVTSHCFADFKIFLNPSELTVDRQALGVGELILSVDLIIMHDGVDESSLIGLTLDLVTDAPITLLNDASLDNPLNFGFPPNANSGRIALASLADIDIGNSRSERLTTLQFLIPDTVPFGDFLVSLDLIEAKRGFFPQVDIRPEFSTTSGMIRVTAVDVPEPSSVALMEAVLCHLVWRRRGQS